MTRPTPAPTERVYDASSLAVAELDDRVYRRLVGEIATRIADDPTADVLVCMFFVHYLEKAMRQGFFPGIIRRTKKSDRTTRWLFKRLNVNSKTNRLVVYRRSAGAKFSNHLKTVLENPKEE